MTFDPDLLELLPHTVQIASPTGYSVYGTASFGSPSTYQARLIVKPGAIRTMQGEVVESRTVAWVASTRTFTVADRITLPDGTTPPIVLIEQYPDEDGSYYSKLILGWTGNMG